MRSFSTLTVIYAVALSASLAIAAPRRITVRATSSDGKPMTVRLTRARAKELKKTVKTLHRAGMQGYVSLFKGKSVGEGATPLTLKPTEAQHPTWLSIVSQTVGFGSDNAPSRKKSASGTVRVGDRDFYFFDLHGGINFDLHEGSSTRSITARGDDTEAAIEVDATEYAALRAFYAARSVGAIKDAQGVKIQPLWGGLAGVKKEECTGATTSALAPSWIKAFERNIPALRQQARAYPEFEGLGPEHATALQRFATRMAESGTAKQTNSAWITVVRAFGSAKLVTASARVDDPIRNLVWDGQWQTIAPPRVVPDLAPGRSSSAYQSARVSYEDFLAALPANL